MTNISYMAMGDVSDKYSDGLELGYIVSILRDNIFCAMCEWWYI